MKVKSSHDTNNGSITFSPNDPQLNLRQTIGFTCWPSLQDILSEITGKALPGQMFQPQSRVISLLASLLWLVLGVATGIMIALRQSSWWLYSLSWAMTVHGARTLQVQMIHQASHHTLVGSREKPLRWLNNLIGHVLSVLLLTPDFSCYRKRHLYDHHSPKNLSTEADPTVQLLKSIGLGPGLSRKTLWIRLVWSFFSPVFHVKRIAERIGSHFTGVHLVHQVAVLGYLVTVVSLLSFKGWELLVFAWFIPLFPLYEISATLRLCVEHEWPTPSSPKTVVEYAELTHGVFCGSVPPYPDLPYIRRKMAWALWVLKMVGHALTRFLILVGDTPSHDYHTLNPQSYDWANHMTSRQQDLERREALGQRVYTEIWGLLNAIEYQFEQLSRHPSTQHTLKIKTVQLEGNAKRYSVMH